MGALTVLTAIKAVEEAIVLPDAVVAAYPYMKRVSKVKRAYTVGPAGDQTPNDTPCFMNLLLPGTELRMGNRREDNYTVQVDFFGPSDFSEEAQALAIAYYDATWKVFDAQRPAAQRFGGAVNGQINLRTEDPIPLDQAPETSRGHAGFRMYLDIQTFTDVTP